MAPKQPDGAQLALIHPDPDEKPRKRGRRKTGRHERAFDRTVREMGWEDSHRLDAAVSLGRSLAAGLDRAELAGVTGYELSALSKDYRDHLRVMGVLPNVAAITEQGSGTDPLDFGGPES